jgi:hypothetical protein
MPDSQMSGPTVTAAPQVGNPLNRYFANADWQTLIGELAPREKNYWNALNNRGLPTLWRLLYAQAFGMDPNTARNATQRLEFCGPQANYVRFRVNLARAHIKQRNTLALGQRLSFQCVASNDDAASLAQTPICGKVLTYVFQEAKGEPAMMEALDSDGYFGEGYVWLRWDQESGDVEKQQQQVPSTDAKTGQPLMEANGQPVMQTKVISKRVGAPTYTPLFPWQVTKETGVRNSNWFVIKEPASKHELMARYPDMAEELEKQALVRDNQPGALELFLWDYSSVTDDTVIVKHFYHKPCAAVPAGRYMGYVNGIKLWDGPCPLETAVPIVQICSAKYFGTSIGYPESGDLLSLQEMIDELLSQAATNVLKHGNQSLWAEDGVEFDPVKVAEGGAFFTLKKDQKPPQAIQWAQLPEATKYLLEYLPLRMGEISGMNSTVRGEPDNNIESGVFASLMQSIAEKFINATQAAYDFAASDVGNFTLEFVHSNVDTRFAAEVSGEANFPYMRYFTSADFDAIKRVRVLRQSPVMNNIAGRFEVFDKTVNLPKDERYAAVQMLATGDSSAWTENDLSCIILIRSENERLCKGIPCDVSKTDDPILHVQKHRASLDRLRTQQPPPQGTPEFMAWDRAIQLHVQHISEHCVLWSQTDEIFAFVNGLPKPPAFDPMQGRMTIGGGAPQPGAQHPGAQNSGQQPGGGGPQQGGMPRLAPGLPGKPANQGQGQPAAARPAA